jgi:uncharacterized membrane protein YdjX (TVP38/TMEM64 family)
MTPEPTEEAPVAHDETAKAGPTGSSKRLVRGIVAIALVGGFGAFFLPLSDWADAVANWGADAGPLGALLVGLLFVPICLFVLPVSSALAYVMAITFGLWSSFLGVMVGALLGAMACFAAGRTLARGFVERQKESRPLLAALDTVLDERSFGMIALVRLSPLLPYSLVGYALGATRVTFGRHALATAIAITPQTFLTCYIGATVGDLARGGTERARTLPEYALLIFGILAAMLVLTVISKRTRAALEERLVIEEPPSSTS